MNKYHQLVHNLIIRYKKIIDKKIYMLNRLIVNRYRLINYNRD